MRNFFALSISCHLSSSECFRQEASSLIWKLSQRIKTATNEKRGQNFNQAGSKTDARLFNPAHVCAGSLAKTTFVHGSSYGLTRFCFSTAGLIKWRSRLTEDRSEILHNKSVLLISSPRLTAPLSFNYIQVEVFSLAPATPSPSHVGGRRKQEPAQWRPAKVVTATLLCCEKTPYEPQDVAKFPQINVKFSWKLMLIDG